MAMAIATVVRPTGGIAITTAMAARVDGTGVQAIAMTVRSAIAGRLRVDGEVGTMMGMGGRAAGRDAQTTATARVVGRVVRTMARAVGRVVRVVPARVADHRARVRRAAIMAMVGATAAGRAATTTAATTDGGA